MATLTAPRIYHFYHPFLEVSESSTPAESFATLTMHLARCQQMGFTHVMCAELTDHEALVHLARACDAHQLALLLELDFDAGMEQNKQNTPTALANDPLPDPRKPAAVMASVGVDAAAGVKVDAVVDAAVVNRRSHGAAIGSSRDPASWDAALQTWLDAGVAGFCCRGLGAQTPGFWQALVEQAKTIAPKSAFIAWTPGCTPAQLAALTACGFDATIASTAWWDYSEKWLEEEAARLARIAPAIATVDDAASGLLHRTRHDEDEATFRARCVRALDFAAISGCGLLVPTGFEWGCSGSSAPTSGVNLAEEITAANALVAQFSTRLAQLQPMTIVQSMPARAGVIALLRQSTRGIGKDADDSLLVVVSQRLGSTSTSDGTSTSKGMTTSTLNSEVALDGYSGAMAGCVAQEVLWPVARTAPSAVAVAVTAPATVSATLTLTPGAVVVLAARPLSAIVSVPARGKRGAEAACRAPRIAIEAITPIVDDGDFVVKRTVGDMVDIEADVFIDGHDKLGVMLLWRAVDTVGWNEVGMTPLGNDRWHARLPLQRLGRHKFSVLAWRDAFATYRDELSKKAAAGLNLALELEEGRRLVEAAAAHAVTAGRPAAAATLASVAEALAPAASVLGKSKTKNTLPATPGQQTQPQTQPQPQPQQQTQLLAHLLAEDTLRAMQDADNRPFSVRREPELSIDAERVAARFSSWYELFPRSQSGEPGRHGTFADVEKRLPAIRDMGFDTLYFPPIHPIGKVHRKGRNNSLTPDDTDPGSPYAIGSTVGGHDALHPELGTLEDFRHLSKAARAHGLELALDFAIQCSPDHPWIKDHPDWFAWRPDGSMRYAENPPKKYEDIVNVDFYADGAMPGLWIALRDVVLFWVNEGVRVFRVDNPHTKPLPFWHWMIGDVRSRFPDVIFLSEAFTRPKVMYRLAKVGFSQSYTYFTWRHTKAEFIDYLTELSTTNVKNFFRPHFFVNTPDINPVFLQKSGRQGFLIRAALATMLSGLWGMYSGFELCEATPVPGKEDYLDSEKYELRVWDWQRPGNIIAEITALNRIRRANPALQSHLGIHFIECSDPNILCFIKSSQQDAGNTQLGNDAVFVAINLDPFAGHETTYSLPFWRLGLPDHGVLAVEDLVYGNRFTLEGKSHQLRLDHSGLPYAIWRLHAPI